MTQSMKGNAVVITGGAGMIGHAAAMTLARAGADVLLVDINAGALAARRGAVEDPVGDIDQRRLDAAAADRAGQVVVVRNGEHRAGISR